jgi:hypothetical protein
MVEMLRDCDCYQVTPSALLRNKSAPFKEIRCIKILEVQKMISAETWTGEKVILGGIFWDGEKSFKLTQQALSTSQWSTECFPLKQCPVCGKGTVFQYVSYLECYSCKAMGDKVTGLMYPKEDFMYPNSSRLSIFQKIFQKIVKFLNRRKKFSFILDTRYKRI